MKQYTTKEIENSLILLKKTIENCQKIQPKFQPDSSQYTLLENRIKALKISISLIKNKENITYENETLKEVLNPIISIIKKCRKAQEKYTENTVYQRRLMNIIIAMEIAREKITEDINKKT